MQKITTLSTDADISTDTIKSIPIRNTFPFLRLHVGTIRNRTLSFDFKANQRPWNKWHGRGRDIYIFCKTTQPRVLSRWKVLQNPKFTINYLLLLALGQISKRANYVHVRYLSFSILVSSLSQNAILFHTCICQPEFSYNYTEEIIEQKLKLYHTIYTCF